MYICGKKQANKQKNKNNQKPPKHDDKIKVKKKLYLVLYIRMAHIQGQQGTQHVSRVYEYKIIYCLCQVSGSPNEDF